MHIRTIAGLVDICLSNDECNIIVESLDNLSKLGSVITDYSVKILKMRNAINSVNQLMQNNEENKHG